MKCVIARVAFLSTFAFAVFLGGSALIGPEPAAARMDDRPPICLEDVSDSSGWPCRPDL